MGADWSYFRPSRTLAACSKGMLYRCQGLCVLTSGRPFELSQSSPGAQRCSIAIMKSSMCHAKPSIKLEGSTRMYRHLTEELLGSRLLKHTAFLVPPCAFQCQAMHESSIPALAVQLLWQLLGDFSEKDGLVQGPVVATSCGLHHGCQEALRIVQTCTEQPLTQALA